MVLHELYTQDLAGTLGLAILTAEQLSGRRYRVLSRVSGSACQTGSSDAPPTEAPARAELVANAERKGADAVAKVVCRKEL